MFSRQRLPWLVAFPALYVGAMTARAGQTAVASWLLVLIATTVALVGGRIPEGTEPRVARLRLFTATGLSVTIATAALTSRPAWAGAAREIGALVAMVAALVSIERIDGDIGLAARATEAAFPPGTFGPRIAVRVGIGVTSVAWAIAILVDGASFARGETDAPDAPWIAAAAGTVALFTLGATALVVARARRLELTVPPRANACAGAAVAGLIIAITLAISGVTAADSAAALGAAIAASVVVRLARAKDPLALGKQGRRTLTLVIFGGPVTALAAIAVESRMPGAGGAALVLAAVALGVGALAERLEEPFRPVRGVMLDALVEARDGTRQREAREAMAHALLKIREACAIGLGPTAAPSPELWLLHPTRVLTVNAAGYLQERSAELPPGLFDVAIPEPFATLRAPVLRALEVRRPDLRPLLAWLDHRDALFATVIAESEDPDGLLVIPTGARIDDLTLEEVRAAKLLADAFVAVSQATSAKVRHLERERVLKERIDELDEDGARLRHQLDLEVGRHVLAATRLARPATVGIYSAISRFAYDALERRIGQDAPTILIARPGIDPVPYVARAHLSGPRRKEPLVVVEGTSSREHDVARWTNDRTSPLALADRGLLLLVDGAALPREIQVLIARAVAERRPPWERATPIDVAIALTATRGFAELEHDGLLAPELASRFDAEAAITLPGLAERPEDLHAIVADRLAREGLRVCGLPVGIEAAAFARLMEYPFEAEDAELAAIVTKLVARAVADGRDVVRAVDVDALGLDEQNEAGRHPGGRQPTLVRR